MVGLESTSNIDGGFLASDKIHKTEVATTKMIDSTYTVPMRPRFMEGLYRAMRQA